MNEKACRYRGYLLMFILGAAISGSGIWYFSAKHSDKLLREAQGTIAALTESNKQLSADYQRVADTNRQLEESLRNRQEVINRIDSTVDGLSSGLTESTDLIQSIISGITELIRILHD